MTRQFFILFVAALAVSCGSVRHDGLTRSERQARTAMRVKEALNNRRWDIEVNYMNPQRGPMHRYVTGYSLELRGDTVVSCLPYFGEVWRTTYGTQQGLNFIGTVSAYHAQWISEGQCVIVLETASQEDRYQYQVRVWTNGKADIDVQAENRDGISFTGELAFER